LTFGTPDDAGEVLAALREDPRIDHAALYRQQGGLFAVYRSSKAAAVPAATPPEGHRFGREYLELTRPVLLHREQIGTISIRARLDSIRTAL
jgi:hypothetical protein